MSANVGPSPASRLFSVEAVRSVAEQSFWNTVEERVQQCRSRISQVSEQGGMDCYCEKEDDLVGAQAKERLAENGFTVEDCSIKATVFWENDRDPFGESIREVVQKKALYVSWDKSYKTGLVQSLMNRIFCRESTVVVLHLGEGESYNLFDDLNARRKQI